VSVTRPLSQPWLLILVLLITAVMSVSLGAVAINPITVLFSQVTDSTDVAREILLGLRLPRVLMAGVTGCALALAGVAVQCVFRNPLAEPALIGVSAGAAFAATLALLILPAGITALSVLVSGFAFLGGMAVCLLVYLFFQMLRSSAHSYLLLIGIAINALLAAALGILSFVASATELKQVIFWSMGGFSAASWFSLTILTLCVLPMLALLPRFAVIMNAMLLGERETAHLGFDPTAVSRKILFVVALAVGASVAVAGVIGFVGLIVPHIARRMVGSNHSTLLPVAGLLGAILMILADLIARLLVAPAEIPVGVITALLGAPFFLYLLLVKRGAV